MKSCVMMAAAIVGAYGIRNVIMPEPSEYILDFPTQNNPLNITIDSSLEKNYFMIIGDWGAESSTDSAVQAGVAKKMVDLYETRKSEGYNLLFIATVGDNFYYDGQNCDYYSDRWSEMYGDLATDYYWLAVFGNHDWGKDDDKAMCAWGVGNPNYVNPTTNIPYAANQINSDKKGCNPSNYYLPDFGYYYRIDELSFELIFLEETVSICPDDMGDQDYKYCNDSSKIGCSYLGKMADASESMLTDRAKSSTNKNFLIAQHFPDVADKLLDLFNDNRPSTSDDTVWAAYGHTHEQKCERYQSETNKHKYNNKNNVGADACESILTGGGGGCCDEDTLRGFFVVGFDENGNMIQPYSIDDDTISCQYPCDSDFENKINEKEYMQSQFEHCCYSYNKDERKEKCSMFDLKKC